MCDCSIVIVEEQNDKKRRKNFRRVDPNLTTLTSNARNPQGNLPDDFATNPRKYRKSDLEISR